MTKPEAIRIGVDNWVAAWIQTNGSGMHEVMLATRGIDWTADNADKLAAWLASAAAWMKENDRG